jgi:acetate---CoA ligase (ADP-forming)
LPNLTQSTFLHPASIAVVGASDDNFYARSLVENLHRFGYSGSVVPVHRTRPAAFGLQCVPRLADCGEVDVAFLAVSRASVEAIIEDAAAAGVKGAIVVAAGLRDSGESEWVDAEMRIAKVASEAGMLIAGPNTLGVVSLPSGAVMYGAPLTWDLKVGRAALIVQSGGLLPGTCRYLTHLGVGTRYAISAGNASATTIAQWVEELNRDPEVAAIGLVVEAIDDWPRFRAAVETARSAGTFVAICKLGRSAIGEAVAFTHTGALAGEYAVFHDAFEQIGVREASSIGELVVALALATRSGTATSRGVGIVSHSGGAIGQLADLCADRNISLPTPSPATFATIEESGPFKVSNPIDVSKQGMENLPAFSSSIRTFAEDPRFALVIYVSGADIPDGTIPVNMEQLRRAMDAADAAQRLVALSRLTYSPIADSVAALADEHPQVMIAPVLADLLGGFVCWAGAGDGVHEPARPRSQAYGGEAQWLDEREVKLDLAQRGISVPSHAYVRSAAVRDGELRWPASLRAPLVVKGIGRLIHHKTRLGLLAIDVSTETELVEVVHRMQETADRDDLPVEGYLLEEMIPGTHDLIVSLSIQPVGLVMMLGRGGVDVEQASQRVFAVRPVESERVRVMLQRLGVTGDDRLKETARVIEQLSSYFDAMGLDTLECNPVRIDAPSGPCVLDALAMARSKAAVAALESV